MTVAHTPEALRDFRSHLSGTVGFVPTMGALHQGHLSLIQKSRSENDHTIVSVFVNPTQFLEGEDFGSYPRKLEADSDICKKAGVDYLFTPQPDGIYFEDEATFTAPPHLGYILEGSTRPGHFSGVIQVVLKLLHLTSPTRLYLGKKDAQQLIIIQKMVREQFLSTEVIPCDTIREPDGLALSSRNVYLSKEERQQALKLSKALRHASSKIMSGERESATLRHDMMRIIQPLPIDYIAITNRNLHPIDSIIKQDSLILGAIHVGQTRLIDNLWI